MSSSRNKTDVKKLFEYWCNVERARGVDRSTRTGAAAPDGIIVESFPESFRDEKTIADIPSFAFPCEMGGIAVQLYSFVLTSVDSKLRFGFCRYDPKMNSAMVVITYLPWHETFRALMPVLADLRRDNKDEFKTFLAEAYNCGVPNPGCNVKIFYDGGKSHFTFSHPLHEQLPSISVNRNLMLYYNYVLPRNMIAVFAAMLMERRIIFTSSNLEKLSSCVQAANKFLYPMFWQHIFVPVLPMKLKDYLSAPMPYLIGVPHSVLETMTPDELGEVVILNCDNGSFESPFDDVHEMPAEIISNLKKQLSHPSDLMGDRVSKIFLGVLVELIGGYRDAIEFRETGKTFNAEKFIESRPSHLRPFLAKMMNLQIFRQFIEERIEMLNTGLGSSDEFEMETVRHAEKMKKRGSSYTFLKNVKDKTNPAVKSAVKSVKEGSRGVKTAYKDLKSKFRDNSSPHSNNNFRSHVPSNSNHDRIDGYAVKGKSAGGHHSAPSSPVFNKRIGGVGNSTNVHIGGFQYANPREINGVAQSVRRASPLAVSSSSANIHPNGYASSSHSVPHHSNNLAASPNVSPASSLASSEMNLSQELQNHPLFKSPIVDRSLKPSNSVDLKHQQRITATRTGGPLPPARPPPPAPHLLQMSSSSMEMAPSSSLHLATPPPYYNHPYVSQMQMQAQKPSMQRLRSHTHLDMRVMPSSLSRQMPVQVSMRKTSTPNKIITTNCTLDNPPDVQSPPVPPRRQGNNTSCDEYHTNNTSNTGSHAVATAAAILHSGIHRLERNCWQDYEERNLIQNDTLRSSSSSNTSSSVSSSGSSSASFVSAASRISNQTLQNASLEVPVPTPRSKKDTNKKESLRSLQPQHLQVPRSHLLAGSSQNSVAASCSSQDNTMNDLISLEDNSNFELIDFDPLNENAKQLPFHGSSYNHVANQINYRKKSTTLPAGICTPMSANAAHYVSNPLYAPPPLPKTAPPPLPKNAPPPLPKSLPPQMAPAQDEDFELLRKYGLDQFTLTTPAVTNNGRAALATTATAVAASHGTTSMSTWTTFD